jgi:hypothetical protein
VELCRWGKTKEFEVRSVLYLDDPGSMTAFTAIYDTAERTVGVSEILKSNYWLKS